MSVGDMFGTFLCVLALVGMIAGILDYFLEDDENGSHRRTDQEIRGNSDQRAAAGGGPVYLAGPSGTISLVSIAGTGAAGTQAGAGLMAAQQAKLNAINQAIWQQIAQQNSWGFKNAFGSQQYLGGNGGLAQQAQQSQLAAQHNAFMAQHYGVFGMREAVVRPKPVVENVGIVLGEIEGFRAWRIFNGCLVSLCVDDVWLPGEPMTATDVSENNTNGAHAFKTQRQAIDYAQGHENFAIGRVKLWGQIIEHELGYRAEFSKPIEILLVRWRKINGDMGTVEEIAKRYGIEARKVTDRPENEALK